MNLHSLLYSSLCVYHFFNFKLALLRKFFHVDTASQEMRKKKTKVRDSLLGFIIFPTLSPDFTKIDWISAEKKVSKDQNSSKNTKNTRKSERHKNFRGVGVCFTLMRFHFTPVKAVIQSHWSKAFDTVLPVGADARFDFRRSLKTGLFRSSPSLRWFVVQQAKSGHNL